MNTKTILATPEIKTDQKPAGLRLFLSKLVKQRVLVFMSVPFLIWLFIFKYLPLWGWTIAFQDYRPALGFWDQKWIGFSHFKFLFGDERFLRVLRNTLAMSSINLILGFLTAIVLALLLNEIRQVAFKRIVQTVSYLPHFISWVVAASIIQTTLSPDGIINQLLIWAGFIDKGQEFLFLGIPHFFWGIFGASSVWKDIGWNTIVYLAAMTTIDPAQYEAAEMDGAGRFKRMFYITLPGIKSVVVVLLIMNIGYLLESGFEPQYLLGNGMNVDYSENIDIFVLKYGIAQSNFSLSIAAGMFKTIVSFVLLFVANSVAKRAGESRLF
ncbi:MULTISPECIES: ABC transporter permease subunit [unclassified Paenibacillus]|uniref:ABC transporter permease n=1 Tax=unclassified Paenibacillus TaxID=185978 RepID=UPI0024069D19|nr:MULTISPECIES: ABC transporter permease subunit [unclassified Paenibacillus]MDF9843674.1 putative aldouronate transport system permease protein [Paenibacillus sp. PastF-2]MDF9850262.1 putative aldouronate transport system permease protein [Paenibacillus sp. PastM-2]MDF9856798.1 putative aldouronate transport system permease protein [Paenibacillus sp. PastF-1]MDH6482109.1 putative aldouronate transport system permease protein [Paenibacillus sp. PastH-2]MDH6509531.1 putative aldouronate transp